MKRLLPVFLAATAAALAQDKIPSGYNQKDILSPFRKCDEVYAPPDALFARLRVMRDLARQQAGPATWQNGREMIEHPTWAQALADVKQKGIDAGYMAEIMRRSRNPDDRDLAFYAMPWCSSPADIFNLISHIPGEPSLEVRQAALPRAVAFMKATLGRRYGELNDDQKRALNLPEIGSPAAKAMGLKRAPRDEDALYQINLTPFFQLLDLDTEIDQAQGLWFLKECWLVRPDLAELWLEPALPRCVQLLVTGRGDVQAQAIGLFQAVAPKNFRRPADDADAAALTAWAKEATRKLFPSIRRHGDGLMSFHAGEELDALVKAGREALQNGDRLGEFVFGTTPSGQPYRGFRIITIPKELEVFGIPPGAVITAIGGEPLKNAKQMLEVIENRLAVPREKVRYHSFMVEFLHDGKSKAIEYRSY